MAITMAISESRPAVNKHDTEVLVLHSITLEGVLYVLRVNTCVCGQLNITAQVYISPAHYIRIILVLLYLSLCINMVSL